MRKKLLMLIATMTLCVALGFNPRTLFAEDANAGSENKVSIRERIDTNGDGTIDDAAN